MKALSAIGAGRAALWLAVFAFACTYAAEATRHYEFRRQHDPNGIGKFYMGREIARIMGPAGIAWLERDSRESEERTNLLLSALNIKPGATVVDFGAGSGYFTFKLARLVGPRGTVIAADIDPKMLAFIRRRAAHEQLTNVGLIRTTPTDPRLPPNRIDLVLMVDVYHELEFPYETMRGIRAALSPHGRVALVEYRQEDKNVPIKELHKMTERQAIREMAAVGLKHTGTFENLPQQHLMFFERGE